MKYLKLFEDKKKLKILYLHGLDDHVDNDQLKFLKQLEYEIEYSLIDYRKENLWNRLEKKNFDIVIGHSIGGYFAYYLSNLKKIPCLMFMPCFDKAIQKLQPLSEDVLNLPIFKNKIAVVGSLDRSINRKIQKEMLDGIKTYTEKIDHDISLEIFEKYVNLFLKDNLNESISSATGGLNYGGGEVGNIPISLDKGIPKSSDMVMSNSTNINRKDIDGNVNRKKSVVKKFKKLPKSKVKDNIENNIKVMKYDDYIKDKLINVNHIKN